MEWGKSPGPFWFSLSLQSRPPSNTRSALVAMAAAPRQTPKAPKTLFFDKNTAVPNRKGKNPYFFYALSSCQLVKEADIIVGSVLKCEETKALAFWPNNQEGRVPRNQKVSDHRKQEFHESL